MVLSLHLAPLSRGQRPGVASALVHSSSSPCIEDAPRRFTARDPRWISTNSSFDYAETNEFLNQLQDARVAGKRLLEFVDYDGISLWQFLPAYLWPSFFRAIQLISLTRAIVRQEKPESIRVFPVDDYTSAIWIGSVRAVAEAEGLPVAIVGESGAGHWRGLRRRVRSALRRVIRSTRVRQVAYGLLLSAHCLVCMAGAARRRGRPGRGRKALFVTYARNWVKAPGTQRDHYDEQISPLLPAFREAGWGQFVGTDCPYDYRLVSLRKLWSRLRSHEPDFRWRGFFTCGMLLRLRAVRARGRTAFGEQWQQLREDGGFHEDFSYEGVSLMPALEAELHGAFSRILPDCVAMLAMAQQLLLEEQPDAVVATYETGPFQRALIIQGQLLGIATVGLMHGLMFDNHYDYMHRRVAPDCVGTPVGFAVPRVTCVWGRRTRDMLIESGHYPPKSVEVTGNWRYDSLVEMNDAARDEFREEMYHEDSKSVVVVASGGQNVADYIRRCTQVLARRSDATPLIRLHPSDNPIPVRELLREDGYADEVLYEGQLVNALVGSDLVISQWSTVIAEAALMDRPVVLADLYGQGEAAEEYVEAGICLHAVDEEQLANAIEAALNDDASRARLKGARAAFISDYFHKIDGRSSQRVVAALEARMVPGGLA